MFGGRHDIGSGLHVSVETARMGQLFHLFMQHSYEGGTCVSSAPRTAPSRVL